MEDEEEEKDCSMGDGANATDLLVDDPPPAEPELSWDDVDRADLSGG